ncbi:hypothetical protein C6P45_004194 [Maudiozyma exigua]|uniref:FYVE-type domain-containing protein n=1 Tax=Maudiozyma exigua TaxID=34358 RepID=A0A9P7BBD7_MAUEX|nr:hypothetical protein C6P45_004194 [Kazachstania exigua]
MSNPVVAEPTTNAYVNSIAVWQPDNEVKLCLQCGTRFDFIIRRHHCRCCGGIFCGRCSNHFLRYDTSKVMVVRRKNIKKDTDIYEANSNIASYRTCITCFNSLKGSGLIIQPNRENISHTSAVEGSNSITSDIDRVITIPGNVKNNIRESSHQIDPNADNSTSTENNETDQENSHCPICNLDLLTLANEEEQGDHIQACIEQAENSHQHKNSTANVGSPDDSTNNPTMKNRMLVYNISKKKDANNENQEYSECPICFEEMLPGQKVGRLECLCVFHYKCIKSWFAKKTQKMQELHHNDNDYSFVGKNFCPFHDAIN